MLATHLGLRWLLRRRAAWLAFASVVLTVTVSIAVMGVVQGFVEVMQRQIRANESDLTLTPGFGEDGVEDSRSYRDFLRERPEVSNVAPSISGYCLVSPRWAGDVGNGFRDSFPALFDAIEWEADDAIGRLPAYTLHRSPEIDLKAPPIPAEQRGSGFLTPAWREHLAIMGGNLVMGLGALPLPPVATPRAGAVVGQELAFLNSLLPGDGTRPGTRLNLTVPNGRGGVVGRIDVEISDTIGTGIYEVDRLNCLIPLPLGRRLAGFNSRDGHADLVTAFRIDVNPNTELSSAAMALQTHTQEPVRTWQQQRQHLVKGAIQQRNIMGLVMILVQMLAVFIVYASFSTLVVQQRRDIGVLLGIGASGSVISGAIILAALFCCVIGGLIGWACGWGVLAILNPLSTFFGVPLFPQDFFYSPDTPISYDPLVPVIYVAVMTVIGLLAALIPAWRASSVDPVEILREGA
jgi:ABC-type lipoprotein release transport system permease subunit